jgi:hypothetical protein
MLRPGSSSRWLIVGGSMALIAGAGILMALKIHRDGGTDRQGVVAVLEPVVGRAVLYSLSHLASNVGSDAT